MREIDHAAIEILRIPRLLLMDHAGLAIARAVRTLSTSGPVGLCCGAGFNGGDGLSAARHLQGWGYSPRILLTGPVDRLAEEPAIYARIARGLGCELRECLTPDEARLALPWLSECSVVVDALLGVGAQGPAREPVASVIRIINRTRKPVVAADLPSGLDGDTGQVQGEAVRATITVTFGLPKQGCLQGNGPTHVGELIIDPITIPKRLLAP